MVFIALVGIFWTSLIKMLGELNDWLVFWIIEIALWLTQYWIDFLCVLAWIVGFSYLIFFSST